MAQLAHRRTTYAATNLTLDMSELRRWVEKSATDLGAFARLSFPQATAPSHRAPDPALTEQELTAAWRLKNHWEQLITSFAISLGDQVRQAFLDACRDSLAGDTPKLYLGNHALGLVHEGVQYSVNMQDMKDGSDIDSFVTGLMTAANNE